MIIGGFQKFTLIDYPEKIAAIVFTTGCNFRCPWCYSSELVLPEKIKNQPKINEEEIFEFLKTRQDKLDGVVICGGEPTMQADLAEFIKKIKDLGFSVKLDTNGSNPEILEALIKDKLIDYIAMDIKSPLYWKDVPSKALEEAIFQRSIGVNNIDINKIKESVRVIKSSRVSYEFRTTVVPNFHTKEDIIQMAQSIAPADKYYLQNFRPEKTLDPLEMDIYPYPDQFLKDIAKEISHLFRICQAR